MGGNALTCTTRRYLKSEYFPLETEVISMLKQMLPQSRLQAIQAYRSKESFGDMDIILAIDEPIPLESLINSHFQSKEIFKNSNVYSFEYKAFQIDLICMSSQNFDTACAYYAYNDLGNFLGRIAHKMGFSLGHEGLKIYYKADNYQFAELIISKDFGAILRFLGYDSDRYFQGFDTLEEIFAYVSSSPYFNADIFLLENRNHISRTRDRKRQSYQKFLQWLATNPQANAYPWQNLKEQGGRLYQETFIRKAFEMFEGFEVKHRSTLKAFEAWQQCRKLFNGDLVSNWTGLKDQALGQLMKHLREKAKAFEPDFTTWVITHPDDIEHWVLSELDLY
jgi:hypothetical protein